MNSITHACNTFKIFKLNQIAYLFSINEYMILKEELADFRVQNYIAKGQSLKRHISNKYGENQHRLMNVEWLLL